MDKDITLMNEALQEAFERTARELADVPIANPYHLEELADALARLREKVQMAQANQV